MSGETHRDETLSWRHLWQETTAALGDRNQARWMCETASGCEGASFLAELDEPATQRMVAHLDAMIARRRRGEPLQYVLGRWAFRSIELLVDRRVLIPRPETEWVADAALIIARGMLHANGAPLQIVDLGTGSGAIGLAMASELPLGAATLWLTDASPDALDVARANTAGIGRAAASVRVVQGSWFDALPIELRGGVDVIVTNPPYIADDDERVEDAVRDWEPPSALFAGGDGLRDVRTIIAGARAWLRPGGALVAEIGADQGAAVSALALAASLDHVEVRHDPAGRERILIAQAPSA